MRNGNRDQEDEEYDKQWIILPCGDMRVEVGYGGGLDPVAEEGKSSSSPSLSKNHIALKWIVIYITSTPPPPPHTHTPSFFSPLSPLYGVAMKEFIIFDMQECGR